MSQYSIIRTFATKVIADFNYKLDLDPPKIAFSCGV